MPVTPLHFGVNASVGLIFKKYIDVALCVVANIVLDIQPFLVIFFDLGIKLHGFTHTIIGGTAIMLPISLLYGFYKKKMRKSNKKVISYIISGEIGVVLHILLDSLMHEDVNIFWPIINNSIANENTIKFVNPIWIIGYIVMFIIIFINIIKKNEKKG